MQSKQQVMWSKKLPEDDNSNNNNNHNNNCFSYLLKKCSFCIENFNFTIERLLCKPWSILSKQLSRKKRKQVNIICYTMYQVHEKKHLAHNHFYRLNILQLCMIDSSFLLYFSFLLKNQNLRLYVRKCNFFLYIIY